MDRESLTRNAAIALAGWHPMMLTGGKTPGAAERVAVAMTEAPPLLLRGQVEKIQQPGLDPWIRRGRSPMTPPCVAARPGDPMVRGKTSPSDSPRWPTTEYWRPSTSTDGRSCLSSSCPRRDHRHRRTLVAERSARLFRLRTRDQPKPNGRTLALPKTRGWQRTKDATGLCRKIRKHQDDEQRLLQVARTIADIDEKQGLTEGHIAEAAQLTEHLRRYPRNEWTTNTTGDAATADITKAYT